MVNPYNISRPSVGGKKTKQIFSFATDHISVLYDYAGYESWVCSALSLKHARQEGRSRIDFRDLFLPLLQWHFPCCFCWDAHQFIPSNSRITATWPAQLTYVYRKQCLRRWQEPWLMPQMNIKDRTVSKCLCIQIVICWKPILIHTEIKAIWA